jgi:hypothetical protein
VGTSSWELKDETLRGEEILQGYTIASGVRC